MITELDKYRDEKGYINIDHCDNSKQVDNILNKNHYSVYMMKLLWTKLLPTNFRVNLKQTLNVNRQHHQVSVDNIDYFYKMPSKLIPYSPIMEVIAATIGNHLNNQYIKYDVTTKNGKPFGSLSKSFLTDEVNFLNVGRIMQNQALANASLDDFLSFLDCIEITKEDKHLVLNKTLEMMVIDGFCNQFDRNNSNYGLLKKEQQNGAIHYDNLVFDNEMWLPNEVDNALINKYSNSQETASILKYYNFCKKIRKNEDKTVFNDFNIYDIIRIIEYREADYFAEIPENLKMILNDFDQELLSKMYGLNSKEIIEKLPYEEIQNNEIYQLLIDKNQENLITEIGKGPSVKKQRKPKEINKYYH